MKIFGIWTVFVALCISVVAAYYSIVGLVAIFAASMVPIIIMGSVLEVGKLTTAVWLHTYWDKANFLMKSYLSMALVLLMFITSMGIFGFLSKAHIEQQSAGAENTAQLERIVADIARNESLIVRAEQKIEKMDSADENQDEGIQAKIDKEQDRIAGAYDVVAPAIADQEAIIQTQQSARVEAQKPYQSEIENIDRKIALLDQYIENNEIKKAQSMIGADPDGDYGPKTAKAVQAFRTAQLARRDTVLATLNNIRSTVDPVTTASRAEIQRLRGVAEQQIEQSNELIDRLRAQLGKGTSVDNTQEITKQRGIIVDANDQLDALYEKKYAIEGQARVLEAEVGPVKYIAELVYGETNKDVLEEAVRWVIIILVVVFDPLAVVLVIAGITIIETANINRRKTKKVIKENEESKQTEAPKEDAKVEKKDAESMGDEQEQESSQSQKQNHTENTRVQEPDRLTEEQLSDLTPHEREEYERNYLILQEQIDQNKKYKEAEQKDTRSRINSVVEKMKDEGRWPNSPVEMPTEREAIREVLSKDDGELAELLEKADQDTLEEVYKEIIKDIKNDG